MWGRTCHFVYSFLHFCFALIRVKEVAQEKGISMGKLHRAADVSYKTIKRIYSDPFYATTTITLGKLARVLGVSPGELIEEVPDEDAPPHIRSRILVDDN